MGDSILSREITDLMDGMNESKPAAGCKAHPIMVEASKKALRLHEEAAKRDKYHMLLTAFVLMSVWLKGDALEKLIAVILKVI